MLHVVDLREISNVHVPVHVDLYVDVYMYVHVIKGAALSGTVMISGGMAAM